MFHPLTKYHYHTVSANCHQFQSPNTIILDPSLLSSISMKCSPDSVCDHSSLRMVSLASLADWGIRKWRCLYSWVLILEKNGSLPATSAGDVPRSVVMIFPLSSSYIWGSGVNSSLARIPRTNWLASFIPVSCLSCVCVVSPRITTNKAQVVIEALQPNNSASPLNRTCFVNCALNVSEPV